MDAALDDRLEDGGTSSLDPIQIETIKLSAMASTSPEHSPMRTTRKSSSIPTFSVETLKDEADCRSAEEELIELGGI